MATTPNGQDTVGQPPTGMIRPPKELQETIEKTAAYVARNGRAFIDRLRSNHRSNPKFAFVFEEDPFWNYFEWRIDEHKNGRGSQLGSGRVGEDGTITLAKPTGPTEPPEFHFSARMPNINAQDLDVVKLTARFAAKNGRAFTTQLAQREASNSQFDFLRPQHSLNQFFNRLVEQYKELLSGENEEQRKAQLEENVKNKFNMLEKAKARAEWVKYQEKQRQEREKKDEDERIAYAEIDWHDFVVVETVLFTDADEQTELPPPTSLGDLQSASLEQKAAMSLRPHNMRIEEAMPDEDLSQWNQPSPAVQMPQPQVLPYQPQQATYPAEYPPQRTAQEEEEERLIRERRDQMERAQQAQAAAKAGPPQMKIRSDYVPRAQAKRKNANLVPCPNCRQMIDADEMEQHMRGKCLIFFLFFAIVPTLIFFVVELLDPRWKEQKAKADARYATSNLSTQDVANNLKRLASQRDDIFDPTTGARISPEEEARRKRAANGYDGQPTTADAAQMAQMQGMNIQEQIRQIHQKAKQ